MIASRVRHTGFVVRNLEKSLKFYRDVLGLTVYKRETEQGDYIEKLVGIKGVRVEWVKLNVPEGGLIELLQYHSHPDTEASKNPESLPSNKVSSGHIALTVKDLDALYQTLVKGGYKCNSAPLPGPTGKTKILYAHDPDGIILELVEDLKSR